MRDIKFRAWDKKENEMFYSSMYQDKTSMAYGLSNFLRECSDIEDTLMQYTGLKDKNGVEIYEGDIVNYRIFGICEVRYYKNSFVLWSKDGDFSRGYLADDFEVIGNIYENPELLEGAK